MKSATRTTMLMIVIAAVSTAVAMYYFPWPQFVETDVEVGTPLFDEYRADQVRGIEIVAFDGEAGNLDRIKLVRSGEKWIIPARQNFVATNSPLIGNVINSLNDRTIYDVMSENQEDHIKFGVVDPVEFTADKNVESLGRRLVLTDRNNKSIASLIVGSPVQNNPAQRYVRAPGKPRVYMIEFNDQILNTQFPAWVSPNALQLQTQEGGPGQRLKVVNIDNYRLTGEDKQNFDKVPIYRALVRPGNRRLEVAELSVPLPGPPGRWKQLSTTPEQTAKLIGAINGLLALYPDDVRRKKKEIAAALKNQSTTTPEMDMSGLNQFGFYRRGDSKKGFWDFESEHGEVSVVTEDGVEITVSIGKVGGANSRGKGKLNHFVMINAALDHGSLKEPVRPEGLPDDESAENKEFRRRYEAWQKTVKNAERVARDLNSIHADWIYLISEDVIGTLRPEIPLPTVADAENKSDDKSTESKSEQKPPEPKPDSDGQDDSLEDE